MASWLPRPQSPNFEIPSTNTMNIQTPTPTEDYEILYVLKGEPISQLDVAYISGSRRIIHLKHLIQRHTPGLADTHPTHIALYIAPMPSGSNSTLQEFCLQLDRNEHRQLSGEVKIKDAFPEPGTEDFVIAVNPLGELLSKHRLSLPFQLAACRLPHIADPNPWFVGHIGIAHPVSPAPQPVQTVAQAHPHGTNIPTSQLIAQAAFPSFTTLVTPFSMNSVMLQFPGTDDRLQQDSAQLTPG